MKQTGHAGASRGARGGKPAYRVAGHRRPATWVTVTRKAPDALCDTGLRTQDASSGSQGEAATVPLLQQKKTRWTGVEKEARLGIPTPTESSPFSEDTNQ